MEVQKYLIKQNAKSIQTKLKDTIAFKRGMRETTTNTWNWTNVLGRDIKITGHESESISTKTMEMWKQGVGQLVQKMPLLY